MAATLSNDIHSVIRQIHSAAGRENRWCDVLSCLRELFRGRFAALAKYQFSTGRDERIYQSGEDGLLGPEDAQEHSLKNPWFVSSDSYQTGRITTGDEILPPEDLVRSAFYERFLRQYDLFHRLCGVLRRNDDVVYYVAVHRGRGQPSFDRKDKEVLASLLSHLSLSFKNHWALLSQRSLCTALRNVIDQFGPAVFVVDSEGRILLSNRTSAVFAQPSAGLYVQDFHIAAERRADRLALLEAIRMVSRRGSGADDKSDLVVAITSSRYSYPLMVTVRPLGALFDDQTGAAERAVIVIAKDPNKAHSIEFCPFARIYDLTPAQARVTALTLLGRSLSETAEALTVSENTVRSHLKQIYWKTDTHGQMDLVLLHAQVCSEHL